MGIIQHKALIVTGQGKSIHTAHTKAKMIFNSNEDGEPVNMVSSLIDMGAEELFSFLITPSGGNVGWSFEEFFAPKYDEFAQYLYSNNCTNSGGLSLNKWFSINYGDLGCDIADTNIGTEFFDFQTLIVTGCCEHFTNAHNKAKELFSTANTNNPYCLVSETLGTGMNGLYSFFISPLKISTKPDVLNSKYAELLKYLKSKDCTFSDYSSYNTWVFLEHNNTGLQIKDTNCI